MDDTGTIENQINKIATKFFRTFIFSFKGKTDLIFETFVPCNVFSKELLSIFVCQFWVPGIKEEKRMKILIRNKTKYGTGSCFGRNITENEILILQLKLNRVDAVVLSVGPGSRQLYGEQRGFCEISDQRGGGRIQASVKCKI